VEVDDWVQEMGVEVDDGV
jgi:hypothetical protein